MHATPTTRRRALAAGLLVIAGVGGAAGLAIGSDHQDTPEVELNPRQDMTDVYAFPGSAPGRIVLVMNSRAFLTPGQPPQTPPSTPISSTSSRSTTTATPARTG